MADSATLADRLTFTRFGHSYKAASPCFLNATNAGRGSADNISSSINQRQEANAHNTTALSQARTGL
ncbi:hypothetical protein GS399_13235 [Pedobacter sp. HMF7647]|uniref:Uncharacterized protein n=1 Tax=Hufsiella arboris TaxID=2695275 RepID=A0A7K1YBY8_9SPHI|nr:hypothetical protein [Hufsiella arboris]MXV51940.1 hypothetical protein [Hufsiella arboris]